MNLSREWRHAGCHKPVGESDNRSWPTRPCGSCADPPANAHNKSWRATGPVGRLALVLSKLLFLHSQKERSRFSTRHAGISRENRRRCSTWSWPPRHSSSEAPVSSIPIPPTTIARLPQRRICGKRGCLKRTSCLSRVSLTFFGDQVNDHAQAHESFGLKACKLRMIKTSSTSSSETCQLHRVEDQSAELDFDSTCL